METPRPVTAGPAEFPRPGPGKLSLPSFLYGNPWFRVTPSFFRLFHVCSPRRRKAARREATRFASSTFHNTSFDARPLKRARSACGGPRLNPTARLRAQEYRLWLKRFPPIRQGGRFPPFKSSTAFRALALSASLRRAQTSTHVSVLERKIAP